MDLRTWAKHFLLVGMFGGWMIPIAANDPPKPAGAPVENGSKKTEGAEEAVLRATIASYVDAFNRGDAAKLAEHWSEGAEYFSPLGEHLRGRDAIANSFRQVFAVSPGIRLEVPPPEIRFVTPDVAIEEGRARVIAPGQPANETDYMAVHVKRDGKWKMDSVRETAAPSAGSNDVSLNDLQWLVGEWVDQDDNATVRTTCAWTENHSFLVRSFTILVGETVDLHGTQVIGFDPSTGKIRSWVFDSDGGFAEGTWARKGNRWIVRQSGTLPDGRKATSINIMTRIDDNRFTFQSVGREVGGEMLPNLDPVTIVRNSTGE
ncbi:MAG: SgcJ/EcaC family oxidoreductase [Planctomycetota bacterium]